EEYSAFHPSVVNRLDRNTSGIIVFAKNLKSAQELSKEIKERTATKLYMAVVKGRVSEKITVEGYLYKDEASNRVAVEDIPFKDAKLIKTAYEPVFYNESNDVTVIRIHLITGRTHQIRAHLAHLNHPLVGDNKYGDVSLNRKLNAKYQLLHAYHIDFSNGESFEAELPEEINVYL
ncbi:MAG: RNA pseudouridine synthase, partial [Pseudobutyrivibrio sp.]|nr:RNA pseudouridine synthase [Pseudobutyrivibrio sp.]